MDEYQKLTKTLGSLKKLQDALIANLKGDCLVPEAGKTEKMTKALKKSEKRRILSKKAKSCDVQKLRPIQWQLKFFQ